MVSTTGAHDREVLDFLAEFALDRELGRQLPLLHYLGRHPGREEAVAREYFLLQQRSSGRDEPADARTVGQYDLLAELGRGAQGAVWLARDRRLGRDVALKVLHQGQRAAVSPQRFRREALVAARLDHPGLATVFDAGEDDGRPWLAMRYVPGEPLAALLARHREAAAARGRCVRLPQVAAEANERDAVLAVVVFVARAARALEFAHAAGVVHRDVKPGNLMITLQGAPVLVDFGLARDHDSSAACLTQTGDQLGTPAYMAPELLAPGAAVVTPAVDLWGLAVVLYECLAGVHPFAGSSRQAMQAAICEVDPLSVRTVNQAVPRGLATILEVALQKDVRRRFPTAAAFAADLELVAVGELPTCRPPGVVARAVRWSRRHPAASVMLASIAVFLVVAFVLLDVARRRETDLREQATARAADLRRLSRSLLFELHGVVRDLPGATEANRRLGSSALEFLQLLRAEAGDDPQLCADVVLAQLQVGDVLGNPRHPNLGRPEEARRHYQEAIALLDDPANGRGPDATRLRAECLLRLGELDERQLDLDVALQRWQQALALLPASPEDAATRRLAVTLHLRVGEAAGWEASVPGRSEQGKHALTAALALVSNGGDGPEAAVAEAAVRTELARSHLVGGDLGAARQAAEAAKALLRDLPAERALHLTVRCLRGALDGVLGTVEWKSGHPDDARSLLERASTALAELAALDPQNEQVARLQIQTAWNLSFVHLDQERHAESKQVLDASMMLLAVAPEKFGADWFEERRAECQMRLGQLAYQQLDYPAATQSFGDALATQRARERRSPQNLQIAGHVAQAELRLGWVLVRSGQLEPGLVALESARAALTALLERDPSVAAWRNGIVTAHQQMGEIAFQNDDFAAAAQHYGDAIEAQGRLPGGAEHDRSLAVLLQGLAEAHTQQQQFERACAHAEEAVAVLRTLAAAAPQDRYVARLLATALVGLGRHRYLAGAAATGMAAEVEALAMVENLDQGTDAETPRLLLTKAMAEAVVAALHLQAGDRIAAVHSTRAARATLGRLPKAQQRMTSQYLRLLEDCELQLRLVETGR